MKGGQLDWVIYIRDDGLALGVEKQPLMFVPVSAQHICTIYKLDSAVLVAILYFSLELISEQLFSSRCCSVTHSIHKLTLKVTRSIGI